MKTYMIDDIYALTEEEAASMAIETMETKGFNIYFIDFEGYFKYSYVVFKDGHHIRYADDFESHHSSIVEERQGSLIVPKANARENLRECYIERINAKLFTEEEITGPVKSYDDYEAKRDFLVNYYSYLRDHVSGFEILNTKEKEEEYKAKVSGMIFDKIAYAYYDKEDEDFVKHHIALFVALVKSREETKNNYDYWFGAFVYEMYNHEYVINWSADYDTLSAFGNITYEKQSLEAWFDELKFTDAQKRAYRDAKRKVEKEMVA